MVQFELVFYPQKQKDFEELDERVRKWIKEKSDEYVIARHDPYTSEQYSNELHYHYYIHCRADWTLEGLAKSLELEQSQIQRIKNKWLTAILYARHINKAPKPLIAREAVETNILDYDKKCEEALKAGYPEKVKKCIPDAIIDYANNKLSYSRLHDMLSFEEFNDWKKEIDNAKAYRVKKGTKRDMQVVYITGAAGSGKTTLAKFFGDTQGMDIFISGSGKDPLDGYDNEECIILDDLRADYFTKSELFKLLDNNTDSSVKSRYFNKAISRCKLLVITSIKEPHMLYDWYFDRKEQEPFAQFARRLRWEFLYVKNGAVYECFYNHERPLEVRPNAKLSNELNMEVVYHYYGIIKAAPPSLADLMKSVSKAARESLEKGSNPK